MNKFIFFLLVIIGMQHLLFSDEPKAILQARLHVASTNPQEIKTARIQPGSSVKLLAEIKNIGQQPSAPGQIFIRFVLIEPLEDLLESRTYQSETLRVPIIYPGQVKVIEFTKEHQWPSLYDFIKQNWNMRHYQAIIKIDGEKEEKVIGYLPIFFSTYYYEGLIQETPQEVLTTP